jgi:prophage regulatory protein
VQEILRKKAVLARTGLSHTTLYARMAEGKFPRPVRLGSPHIVGWLAHEVDEWISEQVRASRGEPSRATA